MRQKRGYEGSSIIIFCDGSCSDNSARLVITTLRLLMIHKCTSITSVPTHKTLCISLDEAYV
jgi:hypothetical protein